MSQQGDPRQPLREPAAGAVPRPFDDGVHRTPYRGRRHGPADEGKWRLRLSRRTGGGYGVHPDRPLACRIYPLARWVSPDGVESFGHLTPHPKTEGVYSKSGTVQDYVDQQQLAPFFAMSERYGQLYQRMVDMLEKLDPDELDRRPERRAAIDELPAGTLASMWVDIEATIAGANGSNRDLHVSIEESIDLHIEAIEAWIDSLEARLTVG